MGKSGPKAPDYKGAAEAEAAANKELSREQTYANRPELTTPWGQQSWTNSQVIDPGTGLPVTAWQSKITLNPQQQAALDSQMRVQVGKSEGAEALLARALRGLTAEKSTPTRQTYLDPSQFSVAPPPRRN